MSRYGTSQSTSVPVSAATLASAQALDLNRRVALAVRLRREEAGLTQADLAFASSMSRSSLANIEAGRQTITLPQLEAIAAALRLEPSALLSQGSEIR